MTELYDSRAGLSNRWVTQGVTGARAFVIRPLDLGLASSLMGLGVNHCGRGVSNGRPKLGADADSHTRQ